MSQHTIESIAYPRAGLLGNPSDGFYGRTIALAFTNFRAVVTLSQHTEIEVISGEGDAFSANALSDFLKAIAADDYQHPTRLMLATIHRFCGYCSTHSIPLDTSGFSLRYRSDIPYQVGFAGSSALIIAALRALMQHFSVSIAAPQLAALALAVETDELGIHGGLQDRVAQVYQGLVYMDFDCARMEQYGHGHYQYLDPACLPPIYIAYSVLPSETSNVVHGDIRARYKRNDQMVLQAVDTWKQIALAGRAALEANDIGSFGDLMNKNFDCRSALYDVGLHNLQMVEAARAVGATAKFTGSGGAIIGIYTDKQMYNRLRSALSALDVKVIRPKLAPVFPGLSST